MTRRLPLYLLLAMGLILGPRAEVRASVVTVPDDFASIQAAFDSGADTLLVRHGIYPERVVIHRPVTILGSDHNGPSVIDGLTLYNYGFTYGTKTLAVEGCSFTSRIELFTTDWRYRNLNIVLRRCVLGSGLVHPVRTDIHDIQSLLIEDCAIRDTLTATVETLAMVADTIDGGINLGVGTALSVHNSWFRGGSGAAVTIRATEYLRGEFANNRIEGYASGLYMYEVEDYIVRDNVLANIEGTGIEINGVGTIAMNRNIVRDSGAGILIYCDYVYASDNDVARTTALGMRVTSNYIGQIERNTVGAAGGAGIVVAMEAYSGNVTLRNNTSYDNVGPAIVVDRFEERQTGTVAIENNIGYGSSWGLVLLEGEAASLSCNDWFGNILGTVSGAAPSTSHLAVDPVFCREGGVVVGLDASSPLLDHQPCGLIGSKGACGVTATTVQLFDVHTAATSVVARWRFTDESTAAASWLERATTPLGPWSRVVGSVLVQDHVMVLEDATVAPGRRYWYRLAWLDGDAAGIGPSVLVDVPSATTTLAIQRVSPNPASGHVLIEYSLGTPSPVTVAIFDLAGREIALLMRGDRKAGVHRATWDGRSEGTLAPPGVYLVRVIAGGRQTSHRIAVCR